VAGTANNIASMAKEQMRKTEDLEVDIVAAGMDLLVPQSLGVSSPCIALLASTTSVNFISSQTKTTHRRSSQPDDAFSIVMARMDELRVLACTDISTYKDKSQSKMLTNMPVLLDVCVIESAGGRRRLDLGSLRNTRVSKYFFPKEIKVATGVDHDLLSSELVGSSFLEVGDTTNLLFLTKQYTVRASVSSLSVTMYRMQYQLLMRIMDDNIQRSPSDGMQETAAGSHIIGKSSEMEPMLSVPNHTTVDSAFQSNDMMIALAQLNSSLSNQSSSNASDYVDGSGDGSGSL